MPLQLYKMIFTKGNINAIILTVGYHGNQDDVELAFFICLHYHNALLWSSIADCCRLCYTATNSCVEMENSSYSSGTSRTRRENASYHARLPRD